MSNPFVVSSVQVRHRSAVTTATSEGRIHRSTASLLLAVVAVVLVLAGVFLISWCQPDPQGSSEALTH